METRKAFFDPKIWLAIAYVVAVLLLAGTMKEKNGQPKVEKSHARGSSFAPSGN